MKTVVLDFETFYNSEAGYTIRKMSYPEYVLDERFKVHGLAVDDGKKQFWLPPEKIRAFLQTLKDTVIVVHNAFFDLAVLRWVYKFDPTVIVDTLAMANHVLGSAAEGAGRNDLDTLAERLGFAGKKRTFDFNGVRTLTPEQWESVGEYAKHDAKLERQIFEHLLPRMSSPDFELWLMNHTLRLYTDRTLDVDAKKLLVLEKKVVKRQAEIVKASGLTPEVLRSDKQFPEALVLALKAHKLAVPMKKGKKGPIPALAKADPAFIALLDEPESVAKLVRARLVARSSATVLARIRTMKKYVDLGIGIPVHLVYYGAHTGRWSGGGGFNFLNLTSPARVTDPVDAMIAAGVREAIIAGKGRVFVDADAAQIECRVLAWLAGEQHVLDTFEAGHDVYSEFISEVLGEDIHKPGAADAKNTHDYLTFMRGVGKVAVLGLGYSMGVDKYMARLRQEKSILPYLGPDGRLNEGVCASIVHGYREQHPNIVQFWDDLNRAFQIAVVGGKRKVGAVSFERDDNKDVAITLPSDRKLYYRNIRRVQRTGTSEYLGKDGKRHKKERSGFEWVFGNGQRVYGGLLAENITQAVSRDILVDAIYAAEQAGFPVVLHVYDSIVCRVPTKQGQACLDLLNKALSTPPDWGSGLVLGSEGKIGSCLAK
jgi:hypothetical protein